MFSCFSPSFWFWGTTGSSEKGQKLLECQLKLSFVEGHLLPELSYFSAHWSIFAVELAAPCQGFLPQIELLEGPLVSSGLSDTSLHFIWIPLPIPKRKYVESLLFHCYCWHLWELSGGPLWTAVASLLP
jgi:hypothetical protein